MNRRNIMTHRAASCGALLIMISATLSGCVYWRLLKMKNQLREFDQHVRVETENGLLLEFLKPVLLEEDMYWLMEAEPAVTAASGGQKILKYVFTKHADHSNQDKAGNVDVTLTLWTRYGKLHALKLPRRFAPILRRELIVGSLRSMGQGRVDREARRVAADWDAAQSAPDTQIPDRQDIESVLGAPSDEQDTYHAIRLVYLYHLQPERFDDPASAPILRVTFQFNTSVHLTRATLHFHGMSASIHFAATHDRHYYERGPNTMVPNRTIVAPSSMATS